MRYISSSLSSINSGISNLNSTVEAGVEKLETEFRYISTQLDDLVNVMKFYNDQQFFQNEQRNQLLAEIDKSLKAPNQTEAREKYEFGIELAKRGKIEQSIKFIKEAIELNPLHYLSYIQVALGYMQLNQFPEAVKYANEALEHAPYYNDQDILGYTYYINARVYEKMGDLNNAIISIDNAVKAKDSASNLFEQARIYSLSGNYQTALTILEKSIIKDPNYFSYAVVDSAFNSCKTELEQLLTALKNIVLEDVQMHSRNNQLTTFPYIDLNDKYRSEFNPSHFPYMERDAFDVVDQNLQSFTLNYNSFLQRFRAGYQECINLYQNFAKVINNALNDMSYVSLSNAADLGKRFRTEIYNPKCDSLFRFASNMNKKCELLKDKVERKIEIDRSTYERFKPKTFFENLRFKRDERWKDEVGRHLKTYEKTKQVAELALRDIEAVRSICHLYITEKCL